MTRRASVGLRASSPSRASPFDRAPDERLGALDAQARVELTGRQDGEFAGLHDAHERRTTHVVRAPDRSRTGSDAHRADVRTRPVGDDLTGRPAEAGAILVENFVGCRIEGSSRRNPDRRGNHGSVQVERQPCVKYARNVILCRGSKIRMTQVKFRR
jgi:hypothetical protein